tara:strand:+ start:5592 stop:6332 length:741 start_codon:yes stop_codon:yes gene_type:complete
MHEKLKKKYGQNFLIDKNILRKIVNLINIENLNILEIGPGNGKLTDEIIITKKPRKLTIVEIDNRMVDILSLKYSKLKFINIINFDILKYQINEKYDLVISNLPYNISSQILVKLSLLNHNPKMLILMFQKEFAHRLLESKLNSINSLINCFYDIKFNFNVTKKCFRPIPKIDSTVLTFIKKEKNLLNENEINSFIEFKRKLFSYKRKTLGKLLKEYDVNGEDFLSLRVENLKLVNLIKLFRKINF